MRNRSCWLLAIALGLSASVALCLPADEISEADPDAPAAVTALPELPRAIHDPLQSRDYTAAIQAIDALLTERPDDADAVYLQYLKGRALTELKRYDDALSTFGAIEKDHPDGRWVSRARFGRADVYVRNRNYLAAGEIYEQEAERLLSRGRKNELAAVYLEFADRYFEGIPADDPSQEKRPDYEQALTYYRAAVKLEPTEAVKRRIDFRIARCLEELTNWGEAIAAYQSFREDNVQTITEVVSYDEFIARLKSIVEATYRLGRAQLNNGNTGAARRTWQDLLNRDESLTEAEETILATLARENPEGAKLPVWDAFKDDVRAADIYDDYAQAAYRLSHTYGLPTPDSIGDLELAVTAAERFLEDFPDHKLAPQAALEIAQGNLHHGRHDAAVERLRALIGNQAYAESKQVPLARQLLGQSYLAQRMFDEAIATFKEFLDKHPTDTSWADVQRQIVSAEFAKADHARADRRYGEARTLWETFLNKYPLDERVPSVLYYFGQMQYADAAQQFLDRVKSAVDEGESPQAVETNDAERKRYEAAVTDWRKLVSKYPQSGEASRAALMIGVTLEERLGRLEDALEAYKKVTGQFESKAQERITRLTEPLLEIVTERKFRSDEQPRIKLSTRNLEKVTVKVYRVDMTHYFRKMHLATGIESLDIALIDPDEQFEHEVAGYEQYRRIDADVEVPLESPGVTAVTVAGEKLEATTMVVVSDLDLIVKSSRNELFVFAQNMRTGEHVEGASLLVSDGAEVFAEERTGRDGVLQKSYDQLKESTDLRVFAVQDGHIASTVTNLNGLDFAVGLTPRGYLYTDRPAYRAGQLVNIKGIVRQVSEDRFTFEPGEKFTLDVYDARSRLLHTQDVALNAYGTVADNLILPTSAPQGTYRVHLHQPAGKQSYETTFTVTEYRLEPVRLSIDLDKDVYFRGEEVTGTISLAYYYGAPLADEQVIYSFGPDGEQITARTDDEGRIALKLETQRFSESQPLTLAVQFPARSLNTAETVYLATRGFEVGVKTLRDVYINGETFDATVTLTDPAGDPVETDVTLEVFERTLSAQLPAFDSAERRVASHDLATDEDGTLRHTLTVDEPGRYVVRATGTDQFGNKISGETDVQISGEKDAVRLRILAEQHHYKVGDEANVRLHWREEPALALITYEGARVLGYQLVRLQRGENELTLPMTSDLAPNFDLSVAVMERNRFHSAAAGFVVAQKLNITLKAASGGRQSPDSSESTEWRPGQAVEVSITATDPQGNPVQTEISLGLVQANLLGLYNDVQGAIDAFFTSGRRRSSVRQTTSCTFRYAPTTSGIHEALLAEQERNKRLSRELRALAELEEAEEIARQLSRSGGRRGVDVETIDELNMAVIRGNASDLSRLHSIVDQIEGELDAEFDGAMMWGTDAQDEAAAIPEEFRVRMRGLARGSYGGFGEGVRFGRFGGRMSGGGYGGERLSEATTWEELSSRRRKWSTLSRGVADQARTVNGVMLGTDGVNRPQSGRERPSLGKTTERLGTRVYPVGDFVIAGTWGKQGSARNLDLYFDVPVDLKDVNANGAIDWFDFAQQSSTDLNGIDASGVFLAINGRSEEELKDLVDTGLTLLPGMANAETAFWDPAVVTGEDGTATVTITMPQRSTAWSLRAKGINENALAGEAAIELVTKKELFGELKLPLAFTAGDTARIPVDVHSSLEGARQITVRLKTTIGEKSTELTRTLDVEGPGIETISYPVAIDEGGTAEFDLTVASGEDVSDNVVRAVPINPYGASVYATAGGSASQSTLAFVEFPQSVPAQNPSLEVVIGPSINRSLLDVVLGSGASAARCLHLPVSDVERAASDVLGAVALLKMIDASRETDTPEARALAGKITSGISLLVSSQRDDGGWNWLKDQNQSSGDWYLSSRVMWALSAARRAGFGVPAEQFAGGQTFLKSAFANMARNDLESQAVLLHATAVSGGADFALLNRVYRERNSLCGSGVLYLSLAFAAADRRETASELLRLFETQHLASLERPNEPRLPWMNDPSERRALYLLALEELSPSSPQTKETAEQLLAARAGSRWSVEKANGPAVMALSRWFARTQHVSEKYELKVFVNDAELETLTVDPAKDGTRRLTVPAEMLKPNERQRINFDLTGRGEFTYSVVMTGFVPTDQLKTTDKALSIRREYQPAQRMFDGKPVPRGFGVVAGSYKSFTNPFTQVPVGQRGEVTLRAYRQNTSSDPGRRYDHLVVVEPIPAGCTVLEGSVSGDYLLRYDVEPGRITFYLGGQRYPGSLRYTLVGYVPGEFKAAPSMLRSLYDPSKMAVAAAKDLNVLSDGEETADPYQLTPDELYHLGRLNFDQGNLPEAHAHLSDLFANWRLDPEPYKESARMLFATSLDAGDHAGIVRYFEIIKEKFPDIEVSFENILTVAEAYRELGEYERSYLVYRMTVQGSFERESQVAGFLDERGEFLRSVKVLEDLLADYPAESYIATATYALAQEVYRQAATAAENEGLKTAGVTRVHLIAAAIRMLDHFVTTWSEDPAADQASFALANALLDLEQYETAVARSEEYAERYPDSRLLDSYWYIIGYSHFAMKQPEQALSMCRKVAEATFADADTGGERPSDNKWEAVYIMGQVYHSLGRAAEAVAEYTKVNERFADAAQAIDFFTRKQIALDEVTTLKPGDAKRLSLQFRNIAEANVTVYKIDLMKFGLMQRNLDRITSINLAGIKPYHDEVVALGDGKDYRDRTHDLALPLKDEGAYLVVCRGENLYASGLALVTPLSLEIQEDATSGRVRVTVKETTDDSFLDDVHVKVIGSANDEFTSGETDLRGLFVADDVKGTSTVIARADDGQYAFYRGELALQGVAPDAAAVEESKEEAPAPAEPLSQEHLLRQNLFERNGDFQREQQLNYEKLLRNDRDGIKTKEAY